jgi:peptidoglycan/xylan/chitin deacetylase (PgdA/CDA1 family)
MKRGVAAWLGKSGHVLGSLAVCAIMLVVPVLSFAQVGSVFGHAPSRKATPLPALQVRAIDSTDKPVQTFSEPLLTVTFDDGWESVYEQAMPLLQKYGIRTTQYVLSGNEKNPLYMSWDQIGAMQKAGHEIACHSVTHPDLTTLSSTDLNSQLSGCKETLSARYGAITNFASPYGAENDQTLSAISNYFVSQRNTNGDISNGVSDVDVNLAGNFKPYDIIGVTIQRDTTVAQLQSVIEYAQANNGWVVLTYHQADEDASQYGLNVTELNKQLEFLSKSNIRIVTMHQAMSSIIAKKAGVN